MQVTRLVGKKRRLELTPEGLVFTHSRKDADRLGIDRWRLVGWHDVESAECRTTGRGRTVVRIRVAGEPPIEKHRDDPFAVKVSKGLEEAAATMVEQIDHELRTRKRWSELTPN